jgi:hypothetical protein
MREKFASPIHGPLTGRGTSDAKACKNSLRLAKNGHFFVSDATTLTSYDFYCNVIDVQLQQKETPTSTSQSGFLFGFLTKQGVPRYSGAPFIHTYFICIILFVASSVAVSSL